MKYIIEILIDYFVFPFAKKGKDVGIVSKPGLQINMLVRVLKNNQ